MINKLTPSLASFAVLSAALAAGPRTAQAAPWEFGTVLDLTQQSQTMPLGLRGTGLQLGHSDLSVRGTIGPHLRVEGIGVVATHEGALEKRIERLFVQTRMLPAGLQLRAGRFASQIGYLNEQHPHADDFVERPLLYRAFLGHHYSDDGLRLNWVAPTSFLAQLGVEGFGGRRLSPESTRRFTVGVQTVNLKLGGDWGPTQAWQLGLSWLNNRRATLGALDHEAHHGEGHGAESGDGVHADHLHGARFTGQRMTLVDGTWKWAPQGNPRLQQLRLSLEHAQVSRLADAALQGRRHEATALSVVWRFRPDWETGWRVDRLRAAQVHEDATEPVRLNEQSAMLVFKPSHRQSVRLQWTAHRKGEGLEFIPRRTVSLQYLVSFGAHGAHTF